MPEQGTPRITINDVDALDASNAYLAAVNPLQEALDQLTWHHGLVIGLAQKDRADGGAGNVDDTLIIRLREQARQVVLAAERTAEAVWELTGPNVIDGEIVPDHVPLMPPRGPQMEEAAANREDDSHHGRLVRAAERDAMTEPGRPELEVERDQVLDAMRWIRANQPQDDGQPDMLDHHHLALIRGSQLGWITPPRAPDTRGYQLTRKGHAILTEDNERLASAAAQEGIDRG